MLPGAYALAVLSAVPDIGLQYIRWPTCFSSRLRLTIAKHRHRMKPHRYNNTVSLHRQQLPYKPDPYRSIKSHALFHTFLHFRRQTALITSFTGTVIETKAY